jgi:NADPH-dependent curcumin reductase CurA
MSRSGQEVRLATRPVGPPRRSDFDIVEVSVPEPAEGQLVVRNDWMSVDPATRARMRDAESYVPPFQIGETLAGAAIGTVVASGDPDHPVGTVVRHSLGWRELALVEASTATRVDASRAPMSDFLGVLGGTGLTAYVGLTQIAPVAEGEVVFISGAAGAVGLAAGAMARLLGASRVIGSAGGPEKTRRLVEEFGFDAAIDYKAESLDERLAELAPEGVDVYFDNVGGHHLQAAIDAMSLHGRIALCGAISQYDNATRSSPVDNLPIALIKRLTLKGFIVFDHMDQMDDYVDRAIEWIADGSLTRQQTVYEGIASAPDALAGIMGGANVGKTLVKLT